VVLGLALLGGCGVAFDRWWRGEPYPEADADEVARDLGRHSVAIADWLALPGAEPNREIYLSPCFERGARSMAKKTDEGVVSYRTRWWVEDVAPVEAADALDRVADRMAEKGWTLTRETGFQDMWVYAQAPEGQAGYATVQWSPAAGGAPAGIAVELGHECARMPYSSPHRRARSIELPLLIPEPDLDRAE
jgi:hypothetical protein